MNVTKLFATDAIKWIANAGYLAATLLMVNPQIAAHSVWPWIIYLVANTVWCADSVYSKNTPYIWMSSFFIVWDAVLIFSRVFPTLSPFN